MITNKVTGDGYQIQYLLQTQQEDLEIRGKLVIFTNLWKLNNTLLTNGSEITKKIRKYLEFNENPNISHQNLCHKVKAVLEGHW